MAFRFCAAVPSYREKDDARGLHGVLRGEHDPAVVDPTIEIGIRWPAYGEMPFEEVILQEGRGGK